LKQPKTYHDLRNCRQRISLHQGGTRSGKTYSCCQILAEYCWHNHDAGQVISIVRKTYPALRATVMRDFIEILESQDWYNPNDHNKTEGTLKLFGNLVEFFSLDQPQKVRGRRRDILYCNEANELTLEDWRQLTFRTRDKIILDFNPSDPFHWLYELPNREDCTLYKSTYKDNPFLSPELVREIELLKESDPDYWRIYGKGERATNRRAIYLATEGKKPDTAKLLGYGLDWGFTNDPTAVVAVYKQDNALYLEELLYERGLVNSEIATKLEALDLGREYIIADSAEPKSITELKRYGYNVHPSQKGPDSIRRGIDLLKRHKLYYKGQNLQKEFHTYKWKIDKEGNNVNSPEDANNHLLDAARYVCLNLLQPKYTGKYYIG